MRSDRRFTARGLAWLVSAGLLAAACSPSPGGVTATEAPVTVEKNDATGLSRLTLSSRAAERLGIATEVVAAGSAGGRSTIPYASLLYDKDGATWIYTNPEGLVFVRAPVTVDRIAEGVVLLSGGPPVGTSIVTVGAVELWGVETGVGGD